MRVTHHVLARVAFVVGLSSAVVSPIRGAEGVRGRVLNVAGSPVSQVELEVFGMAGMERDERLGRTDGDAEGGLGIVRTSRSLFPGRYARLPVEL